MKENNTYHEHSEEPKLPNSFYVNPFTVPENYFEHASENILAQIRLEQRVKYTDCPFTVPPHYFDQLQSNIISEVKVSTAVGSSSGFQLPENYFNHLSSDIMGRIAEEDLKSNVVASGFETPADYFEQSAFQIRDFVRLDKISQTPTVGFTVDNHYFDDLSRKIKQRIATEEVAESVSPKETASKETPVRGMVINRWIKYASAACIAAILSIGLYVGVNSDTSATQVMSNSEVSLDDITDEELVNYLAMNSDGDDLLYYAEYILDDDDQLNIDLEDQDLEDYIKQML